MLGLNKLTLVAMALCSATSMTKQKEEKPKPKKPMSLKGHNFIGSKRMMFLIVIIGLLACGLGLASAKQTVSHENFTTAESYTTDASSKESTGNAQTKPLISVDKVCVDHIGKEGGFFDPGRDEKKLTRFAVKFMNEVNAQKGIISPGVNMIFQSEDGKSGFEFIYGEHIDSPFIIRMQDGKELVARVIKKTFESAEEASWSKDMFFDAIRNDEHLNGFIMGVKDSKIVYYWAILEADNQPSSEPLSFGDKAFSSSFLMGSRMLLSIIRQKVGLYVSLINGRNEIGPNFMYLDMFSILFQQFTIAEWQEIRDKQDIMIQSILGMAYNYKKLSNNLTCINDQSIDVETERIKILDNIFTPILSKLINDISVFKKIPFDKIFTSDYFELIHDSQCSIGDFQKAASNY